MRRARWCMGVLICFLLFGIVGLGEAAELVSPPEGAVYEAGQSYLVRVEPGPGETLISMLVGLTDVKLVPGSKILEYTVNLPKDAGLGTEPESVGVVLLDRNGQYKEIELSHTVTVVLPPTTVVTGIGADFNGRKKTFLEIARRPNGELVASGSSNKKELYIGADYSDGVAREFDKNPDLIYKSLNEKVAVVFPAGQWKYSDGTVGKLHALVKATGPGTTDIIVQYGEFTDRVTVQVDECPYIEGVTDKRGCPIGQ